MRTASRTAAAGCSCSYADGGLPEAVELAGQQTLAYAAVVRADPVEAAHWLLLTLPRWAEAGFDVDTVEDLYVAAAALALAGARAAGADVLASAQSRAREHDLLDTVPDAVGRHLQSLREEFDVDALPGVGVDVVLEELRADPLAEAGVPTALSRRRARRARRA